MTVAVQLAVWARAHYSVLLPSMHFAIATNTVGRRKISIVVTM